MSDAVGGLVLLQGSRWQWNRHFMYCSTYMILMMRGLLPSNKLRNRTLTLLVVLAAVSAPATQGAARSDRIIIKNDTDRTMIFVSGKAQHGIVTTNPPSSIAAAGVGVMFAESSGIATGTEGTVTYRLDGVPGEVSIHWDNPFAGSNSANGSAPAGFKVEQIGDAGNRTLIFFSVHAANQTSARCNAGWVLGALGTHLEDSLGEVSKDIGFLTTPFKRLGIGGWVDTGCEATAWGWPVRDAQHSSDGFWTIDVALQHFGIGSSVASGNPARFVRIEVEPNTPAHASAVAKANRLIEFHGHVLVDTHHGDELIEVHPFDPIKLRGPNPPGGSYTQTCNQQWIDGGLLRALCRTSGGQWLNTSLSSFGACVGDIFNREGHLGCNTGPPPPNGSYRQTCRDFSTDANNLRATCKKRNGAWVPATLAGFTHCSGDISNQDGRLQCAMGR